MSVAATRRAGKRIMLRYKSTRRVAQELAVKKEAMKASPKKKK